MKKVLLVTLVVAGVMFAAITAYAGHIPPGQDPPGLKLRFKDKGKGTPGPPDFVDVDPPGLKIAPGLYRYHGTEKPNHGRWEIEYDITAEPDPVLNFALTATNSSNKVLAFNLEATLDISPEITIGTLTGGSVSGFLTDMNSNGAEVSSIGRPTELALYVSKTDGLDFQSLVEPPFSFVSTEPYVPTLFPDEAAAFGKPIPNILGPEEVYETIGVVLNFGLSPGDTATLVGTFVVEPVPEPSTLLLLGAGAVGLVAYVWRRRRRPA